MEVSVTLGHDSDDGINVTLADDQPYVPEVISDLLRRAGDTALRLHRELHPSETP